MTQPSIRPHRILVIVQATTNKQAPQDRQILNGEFACWAHPPRIPPLLQGGKQVSFSRPLDN